MKITVFQQGKNILITFHQGKTVDNYVIDKADEFLMCVDKFIRKRMICLIGRISPIRHIEFINVSMLTERIIKAIIAGLQL